jgi:hypothetical protein
MAVIRLESGSVARLSVIGLAVATAVDVRAVIKRLDGSVTQWAGRVTAPTAFLSASVELPLPAGELLSCCAYQTGGSVTCGHSAVLVELFLGASAVGQRICVLLHGCFHSQRCDGLPFRTPDVGVAEGLIPSIVGFPTPAAGAAMDLVGVGWGMHELLGVYFTLTTDANVADRYVRVSHYNIGGSGGVWQAFAKQTAGLAIPYVFSRGVVTPGINGAYRDAPLGRVGFLPADTLRIAVSGIQVGDTLTLGRVVGRMFWEL